MQSAGETSGERGNQTAKQLIKGVIATQLQSCIFNIGPESNMLSQKNLSLIAIA